MPELRDEQPAQELLAVEKLTFQEVLSWIEEGEIALFDADGLKVILG